ncbi:aspartyl/asparaginyl beta-hydroxylase domain-containing protein [Psychroserpens algicola]|uniref:Aspartyl/asparaginyl beta-hydroxylase domain-containing protein n=1 Tax=Psychroserpens algicola TaxID=1719034 RepID=A0ABT0H8L8_9FLAO|nr:aspartyl/asparaginyl beta-hydroxylase domain-containing protein [Psychroserpens algicola]MCK8480703.1 aspartyl/asparaginyl beta-hydroxylase domain-containing protein [Psychroserpens algicola]
MEVLQGKQAIIDRVKLPFSFDTDKLLKEYLELKLNNFEYYNVIQLRAPAYIVDASIPVPPPADDYADGSWTDWLDTNELESSPYIKSIVEAFKEITSVTLVRLLRLAPHSNVKEHTDPTLGLEIEQSVIRLTIPILQSEKVTFYLNNQPVPMKPGECWYLKLTDAHRVVNSGDTERVNLTIDMIPNENLRAIIKESQLKLVDN